MDSKFIFLLSDFKKTKTVLPLFPSSKVEFETRIES